MENQHAELLAKLISAALKDANPHHSGRLTMEMYSLIDQITSLGRKACASLDIPPLTPGVDYPGPLRPRTVNITSFQVVDNQLSPETPNQTANATDQTADAADPDGPSLEMALMQRELESVGAKFTTPLPSDDSDLSYESDVSSMEDDGPDYKQSTAQLRPILPIGLLATSQQSMFGAQY